MFAGLHMWDGMTDSDTPIGQRFSLVYLSAAVTRSDSDRMRVRLFAKYNEVLTDPVKLLNLVHSELGLEPGGASAHWRLKNHFESCDVRDLLDTITLACRAHSAYTTSVNSWINAARRIFREESIAYRIDDKGGVHPLIDAEFERGRLATIRGLDALGLKSARASMDQAFDAIGNGDEGDLLAIKSTFDAVENVFKQAFGVARLGSKEIMSSLGPLIDKKYSGRARDAANQLCAAFGNFANAAHQYRHADASVEPTPPPPALAVAFVSLGTSFLRLLLDLRA